MEGIPEKGIKAAFHDFLRHPVTDKVLGFIAVTPQIYILYTFFPAFFAGMTDMYHTATAANMLISVATMMVRRTASRVTLSPLFWIVTAARSYWLFLVMTYVYVAIPVHSWQATIAGALFFIGIAIIIVSRLSLGRNIGFLPARRELVTTGAYAYVRHPIHTGEIVFFLSFMLRSPTELNIALMLIGMVFVLWKSIIEERFLSHDEDYREYAHRVQYRWIPGVI